MIRLSGVDIVS